MWLQRWKSKKKNWAPDYYNIMDNSQKRKLEQMRVSGHMIIIVLLPFKLFLLHHFGVKNKRNSQAAQIWATNLVHIVILCFVCGICVDYVLASTTYRCLIGISLPYLIPLKLWSPSLKILLHITPSAPNTYTQHSHTHWLREALEAESSSVSIWPSNEVSTCVLLTGHWPLHYTDSIILCLALCLGRLWLCTSLGGGVKGREGKGKGGDPVRMTL